MLWSAGLVAALGIVGGAAWAMAEAKVFGGGPEVVFAGGSIVFPGGVQDGVLEENWDSPDL